MCTVDMVKQTRHICVLWTCLGTVKMFGDGGLVLHRGHVWGPWTCLKTVNMFKHGENV